MFHIETKPAINATDPYIRDLCQAYFDLGVKRERLIFSAIVVSAVIVQLKYAKYKRGRENQ